MSTPVFAIGATALHPDIAPVSPPRVASVAPAGESDGFASVLGDMISGVGRDLQQAEALSIGAVKGEAEVHEVVGALMTAEQSLRMAVAVRDKIVSAYLELSRMQI